MSAPDSMPGYGALGDVLRTSRKATLFEYHGRTLWLAKSLIKYQAGVAYAPTFAIEKASAQWREFVEGRRTP